MTELGSQLTATLAAAPLSPGSGGGGDGPSWPAFIIAPIVFAVALTVAINPRLPWKLNRKMYKNPSAVEPSKAGEWAIRVGAVIGMGIAVTLFVMAIVDPA